MQSPDNESITGRLKELIADQRPKSQRAFALSFGADPSFFDKIMKGKKELTDLMAHAMFVKYGVNADWLFSGRGPKYGPIPPKGDQLEDFQSKYIKQLEKENSYLQEIVKTNLNLVLATVRTISVRQRAVGEVVLDSLERLESEIKPKKKSSGAFVGAADRNIDQIEREAFARGNEVPSSM